MIRVEINNGKGTIYGPLPLEFLKVTNSLIGNKTWAGKSLVFDPMPINRNILLRSGFKFEWIGAEFDAIKESTLKTKLEQSIAFENAVANYNPKLKWFAHQQEALIKSWDKKAYAYFLEMGLGKSAIMIANAGILHKQNLLDSVLILSPKGVHRQWVNEQIPEHLDASIEYEAVIWNKKKPVFKTNKLKFFSQNIDAIRTKDGFKAASDFLINAGGKSMIVLDESHQIKSHMADRTRAAFKLANLAEYKRIATGTPISRNIMDAWSQFFFLDPDITGHRSPVTFRHRYCIMGGWEMRQVVGQKNVEEFYELIAPHSFRLTKAEALDLPPKIFVKREYALSEKTRKHYDELKKTFMTSLESGERVDVSTAMSCMLRLQQIVCGYLPIENGIENISNERIDVVLDILNQVEGQAVIWARFREDIFRLEKAVSELGVTATLFGDTTDKARPEVLSRFERGEIKYLVAHPKVGGVGVNQLKKCPNVIYYSNSFDALDRWQSEDRTHRTGTEVSPTYFDLIAEKTIDRVIVKNLQGKKSLSDLTLDQIRQAIAE